MFTTKSLSCSHDNESNAEGILVNAPDNVNNSLLDTEMTCEKVHMLLKKKSLTITDASKNHTTGCWKRFGFPVTVNPNGNIIKNFYGFVSYRNCFITYSFKSNSTTLMNKHKYNNSSFSSSVINSQNHSVFKTIKNFFIYSKNCSVY